MSFEFLRIDTGFWFFLTLTIVCLLWSMLAHLHQKRYENDPAYRLEFNTRCMVHMARNSDSPKNRASAMRWLQENAPVAHQKEASFFATLGGKDEATFTKELNAS